ncbi:hypothetical protein ACRE_006030 [Hapsidospora chrysogenum ATCC 11550]|uniref:Uncharacterized protein n=1 Tax=Hapsidospora chrysogenum (strain ATCC 11550 / CBS 779.69 / DSM 880 / IAM 14645 / JCM 23072 / IMI 49137) TaxID=857340 RepID=A0A086TGJ2_HAPC1|nr:hypothetical protein ACRE_006030 [Hapsidospora chrysogenum ATCC 11550]
MATADILPESHDRQAHRRRPFSTWVKKLTHFKSSSDGDRPRRHMKKKRSTKNNNPYPESGHVAPDHANHDSAASFATAQTESHTSLERANLPSDNHGQPTSAGTASTDHEASRSITAASHGASSLAGTNLTVGGALDSRRGGDSTFSSPAPSVRSLTTTLTTIQSMSPNGTSSTAPAHAQSNAHSIQFSQPFPTTSPASAIPSHLAPTGVPNTYTAATANGLLTDNASILTLASSSKRRRRRSMDTDASVRALAPSSVWGGSRESLPLSVLSANIETSTMATTPGIHGSSSRIGAERNSIYSSTGVPPTVSGDRSSYYAKQNDGASIRSGRPGHARAESMGGTNAGPSSPLAGLSSNDKNEMAEREEPSLARPQDE